MSFLTKIAVKFYFLTVFTFSFFILLIVLNGVSLEQVNALLRLIVKDIQLRFLIGILAGGLLILNYFFSRIIIGKQLREKNIAFDNPNGRVTISLLAMDDLIQRLIAKVPEVKEAKSNIIATKRGLDIDVRLILQSDANLPELSSRLQDLIKRKIQETIGLEGTINVRIHIQKIVKFESKSKKHREEDYFDEKSKVHNVPFQGYRA